jgi:hypothetical protein
MVVRPVDVSPPQGAFAVVDPITGRATPTFQRFLLNLWERSGGFTDEFFQILTVSNLGTIQGLIATGQNEALARTLGDVAAQGRLNQIDRLSAQVDSLEKRLNAIVGFQTSALVPAKRTRVLSFEADDFYLLSADVISIDVYCVGGGGGGGGGRSFVAVAASGGGGGGGGGYSFASLNAENVAELGPIPITIGLGGAGGVASTIGVAGGTTSFGTVIVANGGAPGGAGVSGATATGGAGATINGSLFLGGAGANGKANVAGESATNNFQAAPGGGGGGGTTGAGFSTAGGAGGAGSWRTTATTGGGGLGGPAGASGGAGDSAVDSDLYFGPGYGGGGGGGADDATGNGGRGGDGVVGAGGGGGGAGGGTGAGVGADGGNGGNGRVIVVEHL